VKQRTGSVFDGTVDGDLEFARQVSKFRMERRPLPDQLGVGTWIDQFVKRDAGELVGGRVANTISGRLDRVHFHAGQIGQNVGHRFEFRPVVLDILARGEVGVAAVVFARDQCEHPQLRGR
jgi:hypothetical protein